MNTQTDNTRQESKVIPKVDLGRPEKKKKTGGRVAGTLNKSTSAVKDLALKYSEDAFGELARLSTDAENENTRVAACKEILDRAYGKSAQHVIQADEDGNPIKEGRSDMELARRVAFLLTSGAPTENQH